MKKIAFALLVAAAIGATYSFTSIEKPVVAERMVMKPVKVGTGIGDEAPDIVMNGIDGKTMKLSSLRGKLVLIDFWASWCGPCRAENPNVVALYKELHAKGLNIIGVSLDKDAAKWKEAIAKDGLTWPQISNLKYWDEPIAKQYNVESIPATFILDANGTVVAKDLRGAELKAKVTELLNAK